MNKTEAQQLREIYDKVSSDLNKMMNDFVNTTANKKTLDKITLETASFIERDCKSVVQKITARTEWMDTPWYKKVFMFLFQRQKMRNAKSVINVDIIVIRPLEHINATWKL